jgi:cytochrome P450
VPAADAADLAAIDITQPGFYLRDDYFDLLRRLRREAPVVRTADGSWLVSRYHDIRAISRDPQRFVSRRGVLVNDPMRGAATEADATYSILHLDPPVHAAYRQIVNRRFTPRAVAELEAPIRATVCQVLDSIPAGEPVDLVDRVAAPIPISVIARFFGIPDADLELFRRWSDAAIESTDRSSSEQAAELAQMAGFLLEHVDSPATAEHALLDTLKEASLDGARPLDRAEIMSFCLTLLIAGNETTRHLISGGVEVLGAHADQWAALGADRPAIPAAIEEILRWVTPIQAFGRTTAQDVELGGVAVPAGEFVVMLYASGNRDEAAFGPTAGRFDAWRPVTPTHVAFGFGEHLCLGASLARLEARIFFEELMARFSGCALAGPVERSPSTLVRGAKTMPVVLSR